METITANDAKQNFGVLMDKALSEPVTITKHGRAAVVVTSDAEYQELISLKYAHLKAEIGKGFASLDRGEASTKTANEIAEEVLQAHKSKED